MHHSLLSESILEQKTFQQSSSAYDKQILSHLSGFDTSTTDTILLLSERERSGLYESSLMHDIDSPPKPFLKLNQPYLRVGSRGSEWRPFGVNSLAHHRLRSRTVDTSSLRSHTTPFGSALPPDILSLVSSRHGGSRNQRTLSGHGLGLEENCLRIPDLQDQGFTKSEGHQASSTNSLGQHVSMPTSKVARSDQPTLSSCKDPWHWRTRRMSMGRDYMLCRLRTPTPTSSPLTVAIGHVAGSTSSPAQRLPVKVKMKMHGRHQGLSPDGLLPKQKMDSNAISPRVSVRAMPQLQHQRKPSITKHPQIRKTPAGSLLKSSPVTTDDCMLTAYTCECCPRQLKRFDSEEKLW
jgi:hypothetical protein